VQPIADLLTLRGIDVDVRVDVTVKGVRLAPSGEALEFAAEDGRVRFAVPELTGSQMVEIAY
jgi:hypothetical protein